MGRREENTGFRCIVCGEPVEPLTNGSYRNHCPFCLSSLHVDARMPGDRASACRGVMHAVEVRRSRKGWQLVHRCTQCGIEKLNRAVFDCEQRDNMDLILRLMQVQAGRP